MKVSYLTFINGSFNFYDFNCNDCPAECNPENDGEYDNEMQKDCHKCFLYWLFEKGE